jgi:glycosyltransferase involved in cell wall biosynthesis
MLLYVIAGEFTNSISMVKDGLTHRYYGLYWQLIERLCKDTRKVKAFWYSVVERRLYVVTESRSLKTNLIRATLIVSKVALNSANPIIVIIDYPHSFRGFKFFLEYVTFLILLHFLKRLLRASLLVICDNMDPPLEHSQALGRSMRLPEIMLWIFLNKLALSFDIIIALSEGYKVYLAKQYKIPLKKIVVIPSGTFVEYIPYFKPVVDERLTLIYAGNLDQRLKNLGEQILCAVGELKSKGYDIEFIITGKNLVGDIRCVENAKFLGGVDYSSYLRILVKSHVCLLLYPKCLHNDLVIFTKFSDYIAAGRLVITTDLMMTSKMISECSCGFVFRDIDEIKKILIEIYNQRFNIIEDMGLKARKWAELNSYRTYIERLIDAIGEHPRGGNT